jgi:hypothetical protein
VLLRLAYLTVSNTFAALWLVPVSDWDKDLEILALRHQIAVLERQLGGKKVRFTPPDRALLAALLHHLKPETLRRVRLLVHPDTVLRWHHDLIRKRHAARSRPKRPGRPPTVRSIRVLVLRLVREHRGGSLPFKPTAWDATAPANAHPADVLEVVDHILAPMYIRVLFGAGSSPRTTSTGWSTDCYDLTLIRLVTGSCRP